MLSILFLPVLFLFYEKYIRSSLDSRFLWISCLWFTNLTFGEELSFQWWPWRVESSLNIIQKEAGCRNTFLFYLVLCANMVMLIHIRFCSYLPTNSAELHLPAYRLTEQRCIRMMHLQTTRSRLERSFFSTKLWKKSLHL